MQPALSVIFFTVVSGCGYGLLFLLGLALALHPGGSSDHWLLALLTGAVLAASGLSASMLHLGKPLRAWRALSQWQSSWLSREGVVSLTSFIPIVMLAWLLWFGGDAVFLRVLGSALAIFSLATVFCTSRIYSSLKTIHAWNNRFALPGYLALGLLCGSAWFWLLLGASIDARLVRMTVFVVLIASLGAATLKWRYWHFIDTTRHPATIGSATGLDRLGAARSVEQPHTEENYLTREMGFVLARKHRMRLRTICLALFMLTAVLSLIGLVVPVDRWASVASALAATVTAMAGAFVERWLFFAEAKHVVMLYYGKSAA